MLKEAVKAIIHKDGKYLLLKRSDKSNFFPGCWDFPGGKKESDETREKSIIREVKEETNLDIKLDRLTDEITFDINDHTINAFLYAIKSFDGKIKLNSEHTKYKWVEKQDAKQMELSPFVEIFFY